MLWLFIITMIKRKEQHQQLSDVSHNISHLGSSQHHNHILSDNSDDGSVYSDYSDDSNDTSENVETMSKDELYRELIHYQQPNVPSTWRLSASDIKRICKYIDTSIFDKDKCCLWTGYVTNANNTTIPYCDTFYYLRSNFALYHQNQPSLPPPQIN